MPKKSLFGVAFFILGIIATSSAADAATTPTCSTGIFNPVSNKCETTTSYDATSNTSGGINFNVPVRVIIDGNGNAAYYKSNSGPSGYLSASNFSGSVTINGNTKTADPQLLGLKSFAPFNVSYYASSIQYSGFKSIYDCDGHESCGSQGCVLYEFISPNNTSNTTTGNPSCNFVGYLAQTAGVYGGTTTYTCPSGGTLNGTVCETKTLTDPVCPLGSVFDPFSGTCITLIKNAKFIEYRNVPIAPVKPGEEFTITTVMENNGDSTWSSFGGWSGDGSHYLGMIGPENIASWGFVGAPLGKDINPGERYEFSTTLVAPDVPGTYPFQWQMGIVNDVFFGEKSPVQFIDVEENTCVSTCLNPGPDPASMCTTQTVGGNPDGCGGTCPVITGTKCCGTCPTVDAADICTGSTGGGGNDGCGGTCPTVSGTKNCINVGTYKEVAP